MNKKKVAFICVHNSCRSQIAEALGKHLASDIFESYSAGTETKPQINQDAVRVMKEIYGIDMEANGQYSKLIADIPDVDIAISMGCNVGCPFIGRAFDDNWGLDDPTGKSDDDFKAIIQRIEENIFELKKASVYKGYKRDKIEMRGDRAEISDFPLYLNTVAGGLDRRDQTIGGFSFVVKIYALPVVEIIGQLLYLLGRYGFNTQFGDCL